MIVIYLAVNMLFVNAHKEKMEASDPGFTKYGVLYNDLKFHTGHALNHVGYIHIQKLVYSILFVYTSNAGILQSAILFSIHFGVTNS
jgi:hypothetical protein